MSRPLCWHVLLPEVPEVCIGFHGALGTRALALLVLIEETSSCIPVVCCTFQYPRVERGRQRLRLTQDPASISIRPHMRNGIVFAVVCSVCVDAVVWMWWKVQADEERGSVEVHSAPVLRCQLWVLRWRGGEGGRGQRWRPQFRRRWRGRGGRGEVSDGFHGCGCGRRWRWVCSGSWPVEALVSAQGSSSDTVDGNWASILASARSTKIRWMYTPWDSLHCKLWPN